MNDSLEFALLLFSKWKNESSPIRVLFKSGLAFSFIGLISQFDSTHIIMRGQAEHDYIWIPLENAAFDYSDAREAPPWASQQTKERVAGMLIITGSRFYVGLIEQAQ